MKFGEIKQQLQPKQKKKWEIKIWKGYRNGCMNHIKSMKMPSPLQSAWTVDYGMQYVYRN